MSETDETRDVVLSYSHSWQEPRDFAELRSCLADDVVFDGGGGTVVGGDELRQVVEATESPWKEVNLLASMFVRGQASLSYESVDKESGARTRVAEHLTVAGGNIARILAAICPLES